VGRARRIASSRPALPKQKQLSSQNKAAERTEDTSFATQAMAVFRREKPE
jgi:hypothetical protein